MFIVLNRVEVLIRRRHSLEAIMDEALVILVVKRRRREKDEGVKWKSTKSQSEIN